MASSKWFDCSRFGMFVHLGLYSGPGGIWKGSKIKHPYSEWLQASAHVPRKEYRKLAESFSLSGFDADEWICEAKNAGMKYFIITAKHHEGFALWPSKVSSFNVMDATPCKRDILGELNAACKRHGLEFGLYYSHWQDWEGVGGDVCETYMVNEEYVRPSQEEFESYWQGKCLPQVRELIEAYDPALLWFDSWGSNSKLYITERRKAELIGLIRKLSSRCLVNSRICYDSPPDDADLISMMDNQYPDKGFEKPWETSGTLNESWAYHKLDFSWKSTRQLIGHLVGNASVGGNYQLNVGPTGDGKFQPAAVKRLRELGNWLAVNGEAVYGTEGGPFPKSPWGCTTMRHDNDNTVKLYLHMFSCTPSTALLLRGVMLQPRSAYVLESGQPLSCSISKEGLWLELPKELAGIDIPVIRLEFPSASFLNE